MDGNSTMQVKVKEGLDILRNPQSNMLMKPGETYLVPMNQFWLRRLQDGDVLLAKNAVETEPAKAKLKSKKEE